MTANPLHYLSHLAELGTADIHPFGRRATRLLLQALDLRAEHKALEIGCGTGNTAVWIAAATGAELVGLDIMPQMLLLARRRLRWAGDNGRVRFLQGSGVELLFPPGAFDRIYTESLLGFQDAFHAQRMLDEIFRALKPGGRYVANEAIWKQGVSQATVDAVYTSTVHDFGLGQASPQAWALPRWLELLRETGFTVLSSRLLASAVTDPHDSLPSRPSAASLRQRLLRLRLRAFSAFHRLRRYWHPRLRRANRIYGDRLRKHRQDGQHVEARLFVVQR